MHYCFFLSCVVRDELSQRQWWSAVGGVMRQKREEKAWSQAYLAMGICAPGALSRIELGTRVSILRLLFFLSSLYFTELYIMNSNSERRRDRWDPCWKSLVLHLNKYWHKH
jgi:transcriptional regulator with XRE-family HTH domain